MGAYSCFTKCSLVPGKCFADEECKRTCSIYQRRQYDKWFYFGSGIHHISCFRLLIREAIIDMTKNYKTISKDRINDYIDLLLYLKYESDNFSVSTKDYRIIPKFEKVLFVKWIQKITNNSIKGLISGMVYDKEKIYLYFGIEEKEK